jgi:xanthine dehydrogenase iron-sulfur cluster and FAD-binding subunit A
MTKTIELEINGKRYPVSYPADTPLLYVLRDELGLTGSKYGCGEGQCGACTRFDWRNAAPLLPDSHQRGCREAYYNH